MADYSPVRGVPGRVFSRVAPPLLAALNRVPELVERGRQAGTDLGYVVTRRMAFGSDVPAQLRRAHDRDARPRPRSRSSPTSTRRFAELDEYAAFDGAGQRAETAVVGGEDDLITPVEHTDGSSSCCPTPTAVRVADCGHMGMIEHHAVFDQVIDQLVERVPPRAVG